MVDVSGDLMGNLYTQGREIAVFKAYDPIGYVPNSPMAWSVMPFKGGSSSPIPIRGFGPRGWCRGAGRSVDMKPVRPISVGLLGATGMVGQQFVRQLEGHPWFRLVWLGASERSAGRAYAAAAHWVQDRPMPEDVAGLLVRNAAPGPECPELVFSAMDASVAGGIERAFARAGHIVLSNSRNHRLDGDVPLVIPESQPGAPGVDFAPEASARVARCDRHQPQLLDHHPRPGAGAAPSPRYPARPRVHAAGGERRGVSRASRRSTCWATPSRSSGARRTSSAPKRRRSSVSCVAARRSAAKWRGGESVTQVAASNLTKP